MTTERPNGAGEVARRRTMVVTAAVIVAVAVAFAGGLLAGSRLAPQPVAAPDDGSVDAGFARDMQAHHRQAVQMSTFVLDVTDDPEVTTLARDIQLTQQQQAGQMYGWLASGGLGQASTRPVMAWMSDETGGMPGMQDGTALAGMPGLPGMPGMATQAQLERLQLARGAEADRLYLQLMIPHHEGGVAMAQVAADRAGNPAVRRLAQTIVDSQTAELTVLRDMLDARGGPLEKP